MTKQIGAKSASGNESPVSADSLFKAGQFDAAARACDAVLVKEPNNFEATLMAGRLALLSNRLAESQKQLSQAMRLKPEDVAAKTLLAEACVRCDDFPQAAALLRAAGKTARAELLGSFTGVHPYLIEGSAEAAHLKFVQTDPLPIVHVRVNGGPEVDFLLDTGGGEVILDPEFAQTLTMSRFGTQVGTYAGGKQADSRYGRIDALTLDRFTVKNVPVSLLPTRQFSAAAHGKRVDGVLGTVLLYHFLATLDYPRGELVLRRRAASGAKQAARALVPGQSVTLPFWLAEDHLILAWGRVNAGPPLLFLVDTGLAGGGFTAPVSTLKEASIDPAAGPVTEGVGGAGPVSATSFTVKRLSLGAAQEENIGGIGGVFPPSLENVFGFRIGGLISHGFFRPYAVTLDFSAMRMSLNKAGEIKE